MFRLILPAVCLFLTVVFGLMTGAAVKDLIREVRHWGWVSMGASGGLLIVALLVVVTIFLGCVTVGTFAIRNEGRGKDD